MDDVKSLSHSSWNCKYHIVFAPKFRQKVFYDESLLGFLKNHRLSRWVTIRQVEIFLDLGAHQSFMIV